MRVKELIDKLTKMVEERNRIADMDVAFYIPMLDEQDPEDINACNHHSLFDIDKNDIYVNEWFNGETWDDSDDSYEFKLAFPSLKNFIFIMLLVLIFLPWSVIIS